MQKCNYCGSTPPFWSDLPAALNEALLHADIPAGVRPMIVQAIHELRAAGDKAHVHEFVGSPVARCSCGAMLVPSDWQVIGNTPR